jgi:AraC-like DNA-binding protein
VDLQVDGDEARLCILDAKAEPIERRRFAHETLFVMLHGLACWLTSRRITIQCAEFSYARPDWWREYLSVYSRNLRFDAPQTCLVLPAIELAAPVVQNERSAKDFLRKAPQNFIVKYKNPDSLATRVRRLLRSVPPEQWPDFDAIAAQLRMSPSTLRRRLAEEAQTFRTLKDTLRRDLALRYLRRSRLSLLEIAHALGFAEASAFHRAFRQWTGVSPGEYRRSSEDAAPRKS